MIPFFKENVSGNIDKYPVGRAKLVKEYLYKLYNDRPTIIKTDVIYLEKGRYNLPTLCQALHCLISWPGASGRQTRP